MNPPEAGPIEGGEHRRDACATGGGAFGWMRPWRATLGLVAIVVAMKLLYLGLFCPYTLVEDEAQYWDWSRELAWSYYTKGPGVAWVIAASTRTFAALGIEANEFIVRLPAVVASGVLMLAVAWLTRLLVRDGRAAFLAAASVALAPGFHMLSLLMTIDGPYAASWALAAVFAWLALMRGRRWAWLGLGAALGFGFVCKYTILLLVPGLAGFAIAHRRVLVLGRQWGWFAAGGLGIMLLGVVPIVMWNAQHDWGTVRHLLGHLGLRGGDMPVRQGGGSGWTYNPQWTLVLLASQIGVAGAGLVLTIWYVSLRLRRHAKVAWHVGLGMGPDRAGLMYLLWCAGPVFVFYFLVSLIAEPEGNWPLATHITLFPLAGVAITWAVDELWRARAAWIAEDPARASHGVFHKRPQTLANCLWLTALVTGIGFAAITFTLDKVARGPAMKWVEARLIANGALKPGRTLIPLGRFMGSTIVGRDADRRVEELRRATGLEPFVVGLHYGRTAILAFYMSGRPFVYCSGSRTDGRKTHYDYWAKTDLDDPALKGRPALLVGGQEYHWKDAFERIELLGPMEGDMRTDRPAWLGYGYRGWPAREGGR